MKRKVWLLLIFGLALGLRLYGLTYHSLWFDEVMSTFWAGRPVSEIWRVGLALVQDKHPPLYYLLLHAWTVLWGGSDYAVRSLGALLGALAVFPAYGMGRLLGTRRAAWAAALLLALNPFLIWYSQEARMFMPATTFLLAGLYGLLWLVYPAPGGASTWLQAEASPGAGSAPPRPGFAGRPSGLPRQSAVRGSSAHDPPARTPARPAEPPVPPVGPRGRAEEIVLREQSPVNRAGPWGDLSEVRQASAQRGLLKRRGLPLWKALPAFLLCVFGLTAALYTYLFSALLLPVAGAWVLVCGWFAWRRGQGLRRPALGLLALALTAALFWPLARAAWAVSGAEAAPGRAFGGMAPALGDRLRLYAVGWPGWPAAWSALAAAAAGLLALSGLLVPDRPRDTPYPDVHAAGTARMPRHVGGLLLALWLALPVLAGGLILARDRTVFAEARYFIFLIPALCLAWGRGLAAPWDWANAAWRGRGAATRAARYAACLAATALVLGALLAALPWLWSPQNRREAWRETAGLLAAQAGPRDAVLVEPDYVNVALQRYWTGEQPVYLPFTGQITDAGQVDPPLAGMAGFDTVWLLQSHAQGLDPGNLVGQWFGARYPLVTEVFPAGIALHAYAQRYRTPALPVGVPPLAVPASLGGLRLLACVYSPAELPAREDVFHPPSSWVHVTSYWTVDGPVAPDIFPAWQMVDRSGQVWGASLDRPNDAFHVWPTSRWLSGEVVRADTDVNINPVTPAGAYRLVAALPGQGGSAPCGDVTITR